MSRTAAIVGAGDLDAAEVARALAVTAYGAFLVGQQAGRRMVPRAAAQFSSPAPRPASRATPARRPLPWESSPCAASPKRWGASCSRAAFTSPTSSSTARSRTRGRPGDAGDGLLDADAIADTSMAVLRQPRSAWSLEVDLRPWVEPF